MKRSITVCFSIALLFWSATCAYARDVYGYVFGLGTATGAITKIVITDITAGPTYGRTYSADGWGWHYLAPGGLRWYKNGLPDNHAYFVDVYSNGLGANGTGFYLPAGRTSYKVPDIRFK